MTRFDFSDYTRFTPKGGEAWTPDEADPPTQDARWWRRIGAAIWRWLWHDADAIDGEATHRQIARLQDPQATAHIRRGWREQTLGRR